MTDNNYFNALLSLVSLLGIFYLAFWRYRAYRIDLFRQQMFILRDSLFDEASNGLIDYNHPAYGMLRNTMNGFIRFGHRISIIQFIVHLIINDGSTIHVESFDAKWVRSTQDLSPEVKDKLGMYKRRMDYLLVMHLFFGSAEGVAMTSLLTIPMIAHLLYKVVISAISRGVTELMEKVVYNFTPSIVGARGDVYVDLISKTKTVGMMHSAALIEGDNH